MVLALAAVEVRAGERSNPGLNGRAAASHQTSQRSWARRTIFASGLHEKACANSGAFESGPVTRRFGGECGLVAPAQPS